VAAPSQNGERVIRGLAFLDVPNGTYTIEVTRGFEFAPLKKTEEIRSAHGAGIQFPKLKPIFEREMHGDKQEWIGGDLHVHMNYGGNYRNSPAHLAEQAEAEGLRIVNDLIVNKEQRIPDIAFQGRSYESDATDHGEKTEKGLTPEGVSYSEGGSYSGPVVVVHGQEFH